MFSASPALTSRLAFPLDQSLCVSALVFTVALVQQEQQQFGSICASYAGGAGACVVPILLA